MGVTEQLSGRDGGLKTNRWQWGEDLRHAQEVGEMAVGGRGGGLRTSPVGFLRGSWVHGVLFPDLAKA